MVVAGLNKTWVLLLYPQHLITLSPLVNSNTAYIGAGTTPASGWTSASDTGTNDWLAVNDPCAQLGTGWTLPTYNDFTNVGIAATGAFGPSLYFGGTGTLLQDGKQVNLGGWNMTWTSTNVDAGNGKILNTGGNGVNGSFGSCTKTFALPVRCIRIQN